MRSIREFITELRRRNVFRVAVLYAVSTWVIIQAADLLFDLLDAPRWALRVLASILVLGFVPALIFSWVYEITPEGLKREKEIDRSKSITPETARKLDYATIVTVMLAVALLGIDRWFPRIGGGTEAPVTAAATNSIAVLPFVNMSGDPNNEYFSDGLSEELLNRLTQVQGLMVAGRTSSFAFKGKNEDLRVIAEKLNVKTILEGSVRKSGDRVRIAAQLIDAANGYHRWSDTYDRNLDDIFATQTEIAEKVVSALQISLLSQEAQQLQRQPTENLEAYDLYLRGQRAKRVRSLTATREAVDLFGRATELDPKFATAWVGLASALTWMSNQTAAPGALDRAQTAVSKALALDPQLGSAYAIQGWIETTNANGAAAEQAFKRAIELRAREGLDRYAAYLIGNLRFAEALRFEQAQVISEPLDIDQWWRLSHAYMGLQDFPAALQALERIHTLEPTNPISQYGSGNVYEVGLGRLDLAALAYRRSLQLDAADSELYAQLVELYLTLGQLPEAEQVLAQGLAAEPDGPLIRAVEARVAAYRGDLTGAARLAAAALAKHPMSRWRSNVLYLRALGLGERGPGGARHMLDRYAETYPALRGSNSAILNQTYTWGTFTAREYAEAVVDSAGYLLQLGEKQRALTLLDDADKYIHVAPRLGRFGYQLLDVEVLALRGETARALTALQAAYDAGWTTEWWYELTLNPNLASLHGHPEFARVVAALKDKMRVQREAVPGLTI